jgi:hypothetical protein
MPLMYMHPFFATTIWHIWEARNDGNTLVHPCGIVDKAKFYVDLHAAYFQNQELN